MEPEKELKELKVVTPKEWVRKRRGQETVVFIIKSSECVPPPHSRNNNNNNTFCKKMKQINSWG